MIQILHVHNNRHISEMGLFGTVGLLQIGQQHIAQYAQSYASRYWDRNASFFGESTR